MDAAKTALLDRWSGRRFDATVFASAFALRLVWLAVFAALGLPDAYGRDLYYTLALSWAGFEPLIGFDATHPPLYTLLIAGILKLFGRPDPAPVLFLHCLLGAALAPLVRRAAATLVDDRTARLAAIWTVLDPPLLFFTPQLQTETLFVFMELVFFVGLFKLWDRPLSWRIAALGAWGGLCALCRSVFGAFPAFLFLALWRAKGLGRALAFSVILAAGWLVPTGVWTARNKARYGRLVPMSGQMGWTLWEGFTLDRDEVRRRPFDMEQESSKLGIDHPLDRGAYFFEKTKSFARERPLAAARIVLGKALLYWRPFPYEPHGRLARGALGTYYLLLFALALVGARAAAKTRESRWLAVAALFAYLTALHAVFFTSLRYRLPLEPFLCLLAAMGASTLWERRRRA